MTTIDEKLNYLIENGSGGSAKTYAITNAYIQTGVNAIQGSWTDIMTLDIRNYKSLDIGLFKIYEKLNHIEVRIVADGTNVLIEPNYTGIEYTNVHFDISNYSVLQIQQYGRDQYVTVQYAPRIDIEYLVLS